MYTEIDLREMLHASAARADESVPPADQSSKTSMLAQFSPQRGQVHRRMIAPIAVAACTVALAASVAALTQRPNQGDTTPAADPTGSTASHVAPSAGPSTTTVRPPANAAVPVVDEVKINTGNETGNFVTTDGTDKGGQSIVSQLPNDLTAYLVIAPAAAFNDSKIARTHPVTIAGTTGYYAVLRLYPLSAGGDGGSTPAGTIVFRTPNRSWAFASLQTGTKNQTQEGSPVDDPSAILRGFDSLHASFVRDTFRTPLQLGYLPSKTTVTQADNYTSRSLLSEADISAHSTSPNTQEINISISHPQNAYGPADDRSLCFPGQACTARRHRNLPGGFVLEVQGSGYSEAETQKVIDHITVATNLQNPSTYFVLSQPNL